MQLTKRTLKKRAQLMDFGDPTANQVLADTMLEFMRKKQGIGLASTQVGLTKRVFVMEIDGKQKVCFNPEIVQASQTQVEFNEGCLSFKGDQCIIKRPDEISVRYQNYRGDWYMERLSGLWARCFQHELDHLDGITMWDRHKQQNAKQS